MIFFFSSEVTTVTPTTPTTSMPTYTPTTSMPTYTPTTSMPTYTPTTSMPPTTGPTVCPYGMEHVVVPNIPATSMPENTPYPPVLLEVSPNAQEEEIVEITSTGSSTIIPPMILKPLTGDLDLSPTMPGGQPRIAVMDIGSEMPSELPKIVTDLQENVDKPYTWVYPSSDGTVRVVILFTTESEKEYTDIIPYEAELFELIPYTGIEDIPDEDIPVIMFHTPDSTTTVKKCAQATTFTPTTVTEYTTTMPTSTTTTTTTMPTTTTTTTMPPTTGPTVCPYGMEHVEMPNVKATPTPESSVDETTTPVIVEVSPDAQDEEIVEITTTGMSDDELPKILTPSADDITTSPTLTGDEPKAIVYELSPETPIEDIPESIKEILDDLKEPQVYMYPSTDGTPKVVVTFTTESDKPYDTILVGSSPDGTTPDLYDIKPYTGVEDIHDEEKPVIVVVTPESTTTVKKCAEATTVTPTTTTTTTTTMPTTYTTTTTMPPTTGV